MIGHRNTMTRQTILYLSNLSQISLDLYIHMDSLNIFTSKYIGLVNTINIWNGHVYLCICSRKMICYKKVLKMFVSRVEGLLGSDNQSLSFEYTYRILHLKDHSCRSIQQYFYLKTQLSPHIRKIYMVIYLQYYLMPKYI